MCKHDKSHYNLQTAVNIHLIGKWMGLIHRSVETIDKTIELYITVPWPSRVYITVPWPSLAAYPSLRGGWTLITFSIHHVQTAARERSRRGWRRPPQGRCPPARGRSRRGWRRAGSPAQAERHQLEEPARRAEADCGVPAVRRRAPARSTPAARGACCWWRPTAACRQRASAGGSTEPSPRTARGARLAAACGAPAARLHLSRGSYDASDAGQCSDRRSPRSARGPRIARSPCCLN